MRMSFPFLAMHCGSCNKKTAIIQLIEGWPNAGQLARAIQCPALHIWKWMIGEADDPVKNVGSADHPASPSISVSKWSWLRSENLVQVDALVTSGNKVLKILSWPLQLEGGNVCRQRFRTTHAYPCCAYWHTPSDETGSCNRRVAAGCLKILRLALLIRLIPVFKTFWHVLPSLHIGLAEQLQFEGLIVPNETQSLLICHGCGHLIKDFGKLVAKDVQACYERASQASFTEFVVSQLISHLKPAKTCTMRVKVDPHNLYQYLRMQWYKSKQPTFCNMPFRENQLQHFISRDQVRDIFQQGTAGTGSSKPCTCSSSTSSPSFRRSFLVCLDLVIESKLPEAVLPESWWNCRS